MSLQGANSPIRKGAILLCKRLFVVFAFLVVLYSPAVFETKTTFAEATTAQMSEAGTIATSYSGYNNTTKTYNAIGQQVTFFDGRIVYNDPGYWYDSSNSVRTTLAQRLGVTPEVLDAKIEAYTSVAHSSTLSDYGIALAVGKSDEAAKAFAYTQGNDLYNAKLALLTATTTQAKLDAQAEYNKALGSNYEPIWCVKGAWSSTPIEFNAVGCAALVSWSMLKFTSWVLGVVAMVFNLAIDYTLNFKDFITQRANIIDLGWRSFRDLVNLFFIFILVYIGIGTITNSGSYNKSLLVKVLVTAVLLNFSLFFTQALIDVSNVFSLQFYNKIIENSALVTSGSTTAGNGTNTKDSGITDVNSGISAALVKSLRLEDVWTLGARSSSATGEDSRTGAFSGLNAMTLLLYGLGGSIFVLVTAFVLGAAAYMFILRAITLVFLMILSPLAFAGKILPSTEKYVGEWWNKLWSNLLFAPTYMALMYVVLSMVFATSQSSASFLDIFKGGSDGAEVAFTFFVLIGLMWGCLIIAVKIGAGGAKSMEGLGTKWGKVAGSYATGLATKPLVGVARFGAVGAAGLTAKGISLASRGAASSDNAILRYTGLRALGGVGLRAADKLKGTKIAGRSYSDSVKEQTARYKKTTKLVSEAYGGGKEGAEKAKQYIETERAGSVIGSVATGALGAAGAALGGPAGFAAGLATARLIKQASGTGKGDNKDWLTGPSGAAGEALKKARSEVGKTKSSKSTIDKLEEAAGISMEDLRKNGEWTDGWKDEEITKKIEEHQKEIDRIEVEYKKVKASYKKEDLAKKAVLIQEMKMYADRKTAVQKVRKLKKDLEKEERGLFDDEEKKGDDKKGDKK